MTQAGDVQVFVSAMRNLADALEQNKDQDVRILEEQARKCLDRSPGLLSVLRGIISQQDVAASEAFAAVKKQADDGKVTIATVDRLVQLLSQKYSALLTEIGGVEEHLEQAQLLRERLEVRDNSWRVATLPSYLLVDLVGLLKQQPWAKLTWDEDKDLRCPEISDYARLVEIRVEPNVAWDGVVNFTFCLKGYITENDYEALCAKYGRRQPYYTR